MVDQYWKMEMKFGYQMVNGIMKNDKEIDSEKR